MCKNYSVVCFLLHHCRGDREGCYRFSESFSTCIKCKPEKPELLVQEQFRPSVSDPDPILIPPTDS